MSRSQKTKEALLQEARNLFWSYGYSNVSVRDISKAAGVDVALISRYFGSKLGLFETTLQGFPLLNTDAVKNADQLIEQVVNLFTTAPRDSNNATATSLILRNTSDPEVGEMVRELYKRTWYQSLKKILGSKAKATRFSAAVLGLHIAETSLKLDGMPPHQSGEYRRELAGFLRASIDG
ncbi:MAG: TetR family transcriptional regulator [Hyphomicrobiales bacterium]